VFKQDTPNSIEDFTLIDVRNWFFWL